MRAPSFWWRPRPGALALVLAPLGAIYGAITAARMRREGTALPVPVICVGNFVAGGAGKTPTTLAVAARLTARGERPFILSRGYGGRLTGPVLVDPRQHTPADVGDEPFLMAGRFPVVVARDRVAGGNLAAGLGASVVVMDDGLQNPALRKDVSLAVVDAAVGVGNGLCVPAGPLRAPLPGQIRHADAIVLVGNGAAGDAVAAKAGTVLRATLKPEASAAAQLAGRDVLALSGIGRPEKFEETLAELGARVALTQRHRDHVAYEPADVAAVLEQARRDGLTVATTEKDAVKLLPLWPPEERERIVAVPVTLAFADEAALDALDALLDRALSRGRRAGPAA